MNIFTAREILQHIARTCLCNVGFVNENTDTILSDDHIWKCKNFTSVSQNVFKFSGF